MVKILSAAQTRYLRLRAQGLSHPIGDASLYAGQDAELGVQGIVGALGGVQAQYPDSARLAIGIRDRTLVVSQVEDARLRERSIVRTWGFRGTLHLITAADLGWLLPLLEPVFIRKSRRRYAELGLSEERYTKAMRLIETLLSSEGPLTRIELREHLAEGGVPLKGQALYHALRRAGLEGRVCFGPDKGGQPTYVLLDDWVAPGPARAEEEALAALVRRYLQAYGPAGPEDLAAWSGLGLRKTRTGFESLADALLPVEIRGTAAWLLSSRRQWLEEPTGGQGVVRFLPGYDPYLLGYRSRDLVVAEQYAREVHPGGGLIRPTVILDGQAVGTWRSKVRGDGMDIVVEPFEALDRRTLGALECEAEVVGRFYGGGAHLTVAIPGDGGREAARL